MAHIGSYGAYRRADGADSPAAVKPSNTLPPRPYNRYSPTHRHGWRAMSHPISDRRNPAAAYIRQLKASLVTGGGATPRGRTAAFTTRRYGRMAEMSAPRRRHRGGFTVAESMIAVLVLSITVAALSQAVVSGQMQGYAALHQERASMLAEELMERILALPYHDPQGAETAGPDDGEGSADLFDNMDDYDGFTEEAGELTDANGQAFAAAFAPFSRQVTCDYQSVTLNGLGGAIDGLRITVQVQDDKGQTWTLTWFSPETDQ